MSKSRDNHYVPIWYQEGFIEPGRPGLAYRDLAPQVMTLPNGRSYTAKSRFPNAAPARCFHQYDLYTTFFGPIVNVEIERLMFGKLDSKGSAAVRAFIGTDLAEWHHHFQAFFEYLDIQKIRTPRGLDWLRLHYPHLTQNQLMTEMQGVRMMHCTLWTEGVREIVSAEDSGVKFIISDHPVTIYNYALAPELEVCAYPNDPEIALKASQTIYPLNRNFCLILTNLEYAKDPENADPTSKRTFAKKFRTSMTRTDAFIRTRKLTDVEVAGINFVLKSRARRYIAAGKEEWLHPDNFIQPTWAEVRHVLLPKDDLWRFGGEMFAKFESGEVYYQDQFGRTGPQRTFLRKPPQADLGPNDDCGCGSGTKYKKCCKAIPMHLRPSWAELSIRERNQIHYRAIVDTLGLNKGKDWTEVRRNLTDDQIRKIFEIFEALWPLDTDLLALLPKSDGRARALYTGIIDPPMVMEYMTAAPIYFGSVHVQNPFMHPGRIRPDLSPTKSPHLYRQEILKSVTFLLDFMPFIDQGIINLFPDPCIFDPHLQRQMLAMAEERIGAVVRQMPRDARNMWAIEQDARRSIRSFPENVQRAQITKAHPDLNEERVENVLRALRHMNEEDPLTPLSGITAGKDGGLLNISKMSPNFEIALYLAQATGSFIITDSRMRWMELQMVRWMDQQANQGIRVPLAQNHLTVLQAQLQKLSFQFPLTPDALFSLWYDERIMAFQSVIKDVFAYLVDIPGRGVRPHLERVLADRLKTTHAAVQRALQKLDVNHLTAEILALVPNGGLGHPSINRLLLTSGVDHYLERIPMAFFIERTDKEFYGTRDPARL